MLGQILSLALVRATVRMATPLTLSALGGAMTLHAGTLNIALEGMMLAGAYFAIVGSYYYSSALVGLLAGVLAAVVISLIYAAFVVDLKGDTFVIGIALNLLMQGGTIYLLRQMFGVKGAFASPKIQPLPTISIGLLEGSRLLKELFSGYSVLTYVSILLVPPCMLLFYRTVFGLRLRAAGEHPTALDTLGVSTRKIRYISYLGSGVLCGLAGTHLSLGYLNQFTENMVAGNGFIALAAAIFGQGHPLRILAACILFGAANAAGIRLQGLGLPSEFALMAPYIMTILALWFVSKPRMSRSTAQAG